MSANVLHFSCGWDAGWVSINQQFIANCGAGPHRSSSGIQLPTLPSSVFQPGDQQPTLFPAEFPKAEPVRGRGRGALVLSRHPALRHPPNSQDLLHAWDRGLLHGALTRAMGG